MPPETEIGSGSGPYFPASALDELNPLSESGFSYIEVNLPHHPGYDPAIDSNFSASRTRIWRYPVSTAP